MKTIPLENITAEQLRNELHELKGVVSVVRISGFYRDDVNDPPKSSYIVLLNETGKHENFGKG